MNWSRQGEAMKGNRRAGLIAALTGLSWLGEVVHNLIELPALTILSLENGGPALVGALLFGGWWLLPFKRLAAALVIAWTTLHLVGGAVITVIPFGFLPFAPEQSLRHYLAHVVYGLAQPPLLIVMVQEIRRPIRRVP